MLPLILIVALGQADTTSHIARVARVYELRADGRVGSKATAPAFFELAPASGIGMGTACACASITGASGQAVTFTRASNGWCTKGPWLSGIVNGDLVSCSTDQIRVMPGGDGTGALGILLESSRTNSVLQSQTIDNASWSKASSGGGSVPTVTADAATAPDGTSTADRIQFSACTTNPSSSEVSQSALPASNTFSMYVKGVSGSGSINLCHFSGSDCSACAFNSSTWTRCSHVGGAGGTTVTFGCINNTAVYPSSSNTGAADVYVWGVQAEAGLYATSYIGPTTTAAVTRAVDKAYVDLGTGGTVPTIGSWSAAVTTTRPSGAVNMTAGQPMLMGAVSVSATDTTVANGWWMYSITNGATIRIFENSTASGSVSTPAVTWTTADESRGWARSDSSDGGYSITWSSTSANATPVTGATKTQYFQLSGGITGNTLYGPDVVIKKVCYDSDTTRCR